MDNRQQSKLLLLQEEDTSKGVISQAISQTILPPPKPNTIPEPPKLNTTLEQLPFQDLLITACKQGDAKAVKALLQLGAKPDIANAEGEQPLAAAVWGMCPDIVDALLQQADGVAPMTWHECEQHNLKHYNEIFIVPEFEPRTYLEWYSELNKIDSNLFIRSYHLQIADEQWHDQNTSSWKSLVKWLDTTKWIISNGPSERTREFKNRLIEEGTKTEGIIKKTAEGLARFRAQIKQSIEPTNQPMQQQSQMELKSSQEEVKQQPLVETPKSEVDYSKVTRKKSSREEVKEHPLVKTSKSEIIPALSSPKPKVSPEQLALQDRLIESCKRGDVKAVTDLLREGAKPDVANAKGEQPLGAAVWGMCPYIINALLQQSNGIAPLSWQECEDHNLQHYKSVFIVPKYDPRTRGGIYAHLSWIDRNFFTRVCYLDAFRGFDVSNWDVHDNEKWEEIYREASYIDAMYPRESSYVVEGPEIGRIEAIFAGYRKQIKNIIESANQLVQTSKSELKSASNLMVRPIEPVDQKELNQLLRYVAEGEQDKAEELVKKDKNLLLHAGTVKDLSGREFKQITAFQYALWALDWHMWTMIQRYLPEEAQTEQLQELESKGTAYGKHFSLEGLANALEKYRNMDWERLHYEGDSLRLLYGGKCQRPPSCDEIKNHWCKVVGGEQKLLPAHLVNEYCCPRRPFYPYPSEWESKLPRMRWDSIQPKNVKDSSVFSSLFSKKGLGNTFAFVRYDRQDGVEANELGGLYGAEHDYRGNCVKPDAAGADREALLSLWEMRTKQYRILRFQLLSQNPQSEVVPHSQHRI